jgi:voltage-gated potassium channel
MERPVALAAIFVVPALILQDRATSPSLQAVASAINWAVWLAFCAEFLFLWVAEPSWSTVRRAWFDVALIVLSPPFTVPGLKATQALRALRALRLLRAGAVAGLGLRLGRDVFARRKFHLVVLVATAIIFLGALGVFAIEGETNKAVSTFGDALWWSVVTATTVGYGDISPQTTEGRLIAVVLMLTGISVIGVFTATIANFFFEDRHAAHGASLDDISRRLQGIEAKLDRLIAERLEQR